MMASEFDTVDALMAHYAAGTLPEPARVLVEAHLEMKAVNRATVAAFEAVAGDMIEAIEPVSLRARDRTLTSIFAAPIPSPDVLRTARPAATGDTLRLPRAIRDLVGYEADDIPWRRKLPGLKEYALGKIDGCDVNVFWIRPGRAVPEHTHQGFELSLVLKGAFNDERGRFGPGDISVADDALDHRPVAEGADPCIVFAVTDAPLKLTGSMRQRLGDLIG